MNATFHCAILNNYSSKCFRVCDLFSPKRLSARNLILRLSINCPSNLALNFLKKLNHTQKSPDFLSATEKIFFFAWQVNHSHFAFCVNRWYFLFLSALNCTTEIQIFKLCSHCRCYCWSNLIIFLSHITTAVTVRVSLILFSKSLSLLEGVWASHHREKVFVLNHVFQGNLLNLLGPVCFAERHPSTLSFFLRMILRSSS